jgi:hypothetical protein
MNELNARGYFIHVLTAMAAGTDEGFLNLRLAHAERRHALRKLGFFFEADGECAHSE